MTIVNDLKPYRKFLIALAGAAISTALQFYGNNPYVVLVSTLLTALGVHYTPNQANNQSPEAQGR